jgi:hypothetical protein
MGGVILLAREQLVLIDWGGGRRRCLHSGQHGQGMLESKQEREKDGHRIIQAKEWSCTARLLEERDARSEEEGIVIGPEQTLSNCSISLKYHQRLQLTAKIRAQSPEPGARSLKRTW